MLLLGFLTPTLVLMVIPPLVVPALCPTPPLLRRALDFGPSGVDGSCFFLGRGSPGFLFRSISNASGRRTGEVIVELEAVDAEEDVGDGSDDADEEKAPVGSTGTKDDEVGIASSGTVSPEGENGMVIPCSRSLPLEAM